MAFSNQLSAFFSRPIFKNPLLYFLGGLVVGGFAVVMAIELKGDAEPSRQLKEPIEVLELDKNASLSEPPRLFVERQVREVTKALSTDDPIKDYLLAFLSALMGASLGGIVAIRVNLSQAELALYQQNVLAVNRVLLEAEAVYSTLYSIKSVYLAQLNRNPARFERIFAVQVIHGRFLEITPDVAQFAFLLPSLRDADEDSNQWVQAPRIRVFFENYNLLLSKWGERNQILQWFQQTIYNGDTRVKLSEDYLRATFSKEELAKLSFLTEHVLKLTDDLLIDVRDFMQKFPKHVNKVIPNKKIKGLPRIVDLSVPDSVISAGLFNRIPPIDFAFLGEFYDGHVPEEQLRAQFETGNGEV